MNATIPRRSPRWAQRLLGVSLFAKIILANGLLVGVLGAAALVLVATLQPNEYGWMAAGWLAGVVAVVAVNGLLVHLALRPLRSVEAMARRVEAGDITARIVPSSLADRELRRLTEVLNRMLDSLETARGRQLELSARILEAEEGERKRIAAELFDGSAQLLSAALLHLRLAVRGLETSGDAASGPRAPSAALASARNDLHAALAEIQRIARGLRPPELDELGPIAALRMQARRLTTETGIRVEIGGDAVEADLHAGTALALYRILQEGLANAVTHGGPTRIEIELQLRDGVLRGVVSDDGCGFDADRIASRPERHVGILRMFERARHAGGWVTVDSRPGGGTRLTVEIPRTSPTPGPGDVTCTIRPTLEALPA